jgi:phosphohistidine phosphatase
MAAVRSLYLVRHGIAAERGDAWPDDALRPLTHQGITRMRRGARGLRALGVSFDLVLTSPLVRAADTAAILAKAFDPRPDVRTTAALAPGGAPTRLTDVLGAHPKAMSIALVGHEPGLGELAAWLIGAHEPLVFKKGGVCRIDTAAWPPDRRGRLVWLATPRMLRALDR